MTRTRQKSGKATLALAKQIYDHEFDDLISGNTEGKAQWFDHSAERMIDTQQKIINLLGMDCNTFQSCVLIMQDRYGKFMEASKEDRMEVLANLLGLGIYDELEKLAKDKLTEVNRTIKSLKANIEKLESEVSTEDDLRTEAGQVEIQLACANDDLKTAREELAGYQAQLVAIEGFIREIETLDREVKQKTDAYVDKKAKKEDLERRVFETESFLEGEQNILDKCAELDSTRMNIAAMDGKLKLLEDKRLQCGKSNRELNNAQVQRRDIAARLSAIKNSLQDRERLTAIVEGNTAEVELEKYDMLRYRVQCLNEDLQTARIKASNYTAETVSHCRQEQIEIDALQKQIAMLENSDCINVEKANCRFLQSAKTAKTKIDIITARLADYEVEANKKTIEFNDAVDSLLNQIAGLAYDSKHHEELIKTVKEYREAKDKLAKMAADSATADLLHEQYVELGEKIIDIEKEVVKWMASAGMPVFRSVSCK